MHTEELPLSDGDFDELVELCHGDNDAFDLIVDKKDVKIYKMNDSRSGVHLIKATSTLAKIPPRVVFTLLYDLELRHDWDPLLVDMESLERYDENQDVIFFRVEGPIGIADREFLQYRGRRHEKGRHVILFKQGPNELVEEVDDRVRAETLIAGYVIEPHNGGSIVTVVSQNDIKGMIPKSVVNLFASNQPLKWFQKFEKVVDKYMKGEL